MKKKRILSITAAMLVLTLIFAGGCAPKEKPTPPASPAPITTPNNPPPVQNSPKVDVTPGGVTPPMGGETGDTIPGFAEGGTVEAEKLPEKVKKAIKERYSEAVIKSATYATYENKQTYKVVIEKPEDKTSEELYVTAGGELIPATSASQSPDVSAAPKAKK